MLKTEVSSPWTVKVFIKLCFLQVFEFALNAGLFF